MICQMDFKNLQMSILNINFQLILILTLLVTESRACWNAVFVILLNGDEDLYCYYV